MNIGLILLVSAYLFVVAIFLIADIYWSWKIKQWEREEKQNEL